MYYPKLVFNPGSAYIETATRTFIMKGGYVRMLQAAPGEYVWGYQKRRIDWDALRAQFEVKKEKASLVMECADVTCKLKPRVFEAKTHEKALQKAWVKGWYHKEFDGVKTSFCPQHKPVVENTHWYAGAHVHDRTDGETYTVMKYTGRGSISINFGCWPELWCENNLGHEMVFVFWQGKIPDNLHIV